MRGTRRPSLGTDDFRVQCSNEPPNTNGLLLIGTKVQNGWEPFGLELRLHLGFFWPLATMLSDFGGAASVELPIPSAPWLVDLHVNLQSIWMANAGAGDTCSGAAFNLAPSRGLRLTIQP